MEGTVTSIAADRGFGLIAGTDDRDFFFHRSAPAGHDFGDFAEGHRAIFEAKEQSAGDEPGEHPRAVNVRLAESELPATDHAKLPPEKTG